MDATEGILSLTDSTRTPRTGSHVAGLPTRGCRRLSEGILETPVLSDVEISARRQRSLSYWKELPDSHFFTSLDPPRVPDLVLELVPGFVTCSPATVFFSCSTSLLRVCTWNCASL